MATKRFLSFGKEELLAKKKPELLKSIKLSPSFWETLKENDVINETEITRIQKGGRASGQAQVYDLIDHLMAGSDQKYEGFLKTLAETNHEDVVTQVLGEKLRDATPSPDVPPQVKIKPMQSPNKEEVLIKKKSELLKRLELSPLFWRLLEKYGVLTDNEIEDIQKMTTVTEEVQKFYLINRLIVGTDYEYMGFLKTLSGTGQEELVTQVLREKLPETQ